LACRIVTIVHARVAVASPVRRRSDREPDPWPSFR
jgi:hypothetical protein